MRNPFPDYPDGTARLFKLIRNKKGAITRKTKKKNPKKKSSDLSTKPIHNKLEKSGWNGQFLDKIPDTKVKSGSAKPSKWSYYP